jgi:polar amino acid transport system ATP-binding protein
MRFARDVSSRVFYMDEGLIYEEGSPQQIFNTPEKEKTRQFIRRLKVMQFELGGDSQDFPAFYSEVEGFVQKHMLSEKLRQGMLRVTDELCSEIILNSLKVRESVDITFEYDQEHGEVGFAVEYGGPEADPLSDDTSISVILIRNAAPDTSYRYEDGKNKVEGHIRG